jgi:hypothetical protein
LAVDAELFLTILRVGIDSTVLGGCVSDRHLRRDARIPRIAGKLAAR